MCTFSTQGIEILPRSLICSINGVDVVDSWTPYSSMKKQEPKVTSLEDLAVSVDGQSYSRSREKS